MPKLTIVTGSDRIYAPIIKTTEARAKGFGYDVVVLDMGKLGFGRKFLPQDIGGATARQEARWRNCRKSTYNKPLYMQAIRDEVEGPLVWIDGDAILHAPIDDAFDHEFDIGVTCRFMRGDTQRDILWETPEQIRLNTGVVFIKDTIKARKLLAKWCNQIVNGRFQKHDQDHLRVLIDAMDRPSEVVGTTEYWNSVHIRWMEERYNVLIYEPVQMEHPPRDARVLHCLRGNWEGKFAKYHG